MAEILSNSAANFHYRRIQSNNRSRARGLDLLLLSGLAIRLDDAASPLLYTPGSPVAFRLFGPESTVHTVSVQWQLEPTV